MAKLNTAQTTLTVQTTWAGLDDPTSSGSSTGSYIDSAQILSFVNRRTYWQATKKYFLESIVITSGEGTDSLAHNAQVRFSTIPDTWVTANAVTKAFGLWKEMNKKVLDDNPSVQGKWRNFKVYLDENHYSGGGNSNGPHLNLLPSDLPGNEINVGEWEMSELVRPQHEVDPATGLPLAADKFHLNVIGDDTGSMNPGSTLNCGGIIKMYQDTRAQVVTSPVVPAAMSTSWGTLLTDDGSQEPELADIIEDESDEPPYDKDGYVGSEVNWRYSVLAGMGHLNPYVPQLTIPGFCAPCGLIKLDVRVDEEDKDKAVYLQLNYMKGTDKGVATVPIRQ